MPYPTPPPLPDRESSHDSDSESTDYSDDRRDLTEPDDDGDDNDEEEDDEDDEDSRHNSGDDVAKAILAVSERTKDMADVLNKAARNGVPIVDLTEDVDDAGSVKSSILIANRDEIYEAHENVKKRKAEVDHVDEDEIYEALENIKKRKAENDGRHATASKKPALANTSKGHGSIVEPIDFKGRIVHCTNCYELFDNAIPAKHGDCRYHDGELERDESFDFDDWNSCGCEDDEDGNRVTYPHIFVWTCCDKPGGEEQDSGGHIWTDGCQTGHHQNRLADRTKYAELMKLDTW